MMVRGYSSDVVTGCLLLPTITIVKCTLKDLRTGTEINRYQFLAWVHGGLVGSTQLAAAAGDVSESGVIRTHHIILCLLLHRMRIGCGEMAWSNITVAS